MILLRDDDANATTQPERLARAYAPLLDAGYPINFAVIPEVALDTCAPGGSRERFIDESAPHTSATVALQSDSDLAVWRFGTVRHAVADLETCARWWWGGRRRFVSS